MAKHSILDALNEKFGVKGKSIVDALNKKNGTNHNTISDAIGDMEIGGGVVVVDELPETGKEKTLYAVKNGDSFSYYVWYNDSWLGKAKELEMATVTLSNHPLVVAPVIDGSTITCKSIEELESCQIPLINGHAYLYGSISEAYAVSGNIAMSSNEYQYIFDVTGDGTISNPRD